MSEPSPSHPAPPRFRLAGRERSESNAPRRGGGRGDRFGRRRDPVFADNEVVDYKDFARLRRCLDERGRLLPRRRLRHSAKIHRRVTVAVKRARQMALLPFVSRDGRP